MVNLKEYYEIGCNRITEKNIQLLRQLTTVEMKKQILEEYENQAQLISEKRANIISSSNPDGDINYVRSSKNPYIYLNPEKMGISKSFYLQLIKLLEKDGIVKLNPDNEYQFKEV